jgi:hypothetical protein
LNPPTSWILHGLGPENLEHSSLPKAFITHEDCNLMKLWHRLSIVYFMSFIPRELHKFLAIYSSVTASQALTPTVPASSAISVEKRKDRYLCTSRDEFINRVEILSKFRNTEVFGGNKYHLVRIVHIRFGTVTKQRKTYIVIPISGNST